MVDLLKKKDWDWKVMVFQVGGILKLKPNEKVRIDLQETKLVEAVQDKYFRELLQNPSVYWSAKGSNAESREVVEAVLSMYSLDSALERFQFNSLIVEELIRQTEQYMQDIDTKEIERYTNEYMQVVGTECIVDIRWRKGNNYEFKGLSGIRYQTSLSLISAMSGILEKHPEVKKILFRLNCKKKYDIDKYAKNALKGYMLKCKESGIEFVLDTSECGEEIKEEFVDLQNYAKEYSAEERVKYFDGLEVGTVCLLGKYVSTKTDKDALGRYGNGKCASIRVAIVKKNTEETIEFTTLNGKVFGAELSYTDTTPTTEIKTYKEVANKKSEIGVENVFTGSKYVLGRFRDDKEAEFVEMELEGKKVKMPQGFKVLLELKKHEDELKAKGIEFNGKLLYEEVNEVLSRM